MSTTMPPELTSEAWAQIRHDYEHTERPVGDICAEYGISTGTLRDRMRRWGWTRRRPPIPDEGPPPAPPMDVAPAPLRAERSCGAAAAHGEIPPYGSDPAYLAPASPADIPSCGSAAPDGRAIVPRLQSAVARVLPAIEATLATLSAGPAHPREMERAARVLAALTRTLSELNGLLRQHEAGAASPAHGVQPRDPEEIRRSLARKLEAIIAERESGQSEGVGESAGRTGEA
jgi:hypothetical protein